MVKPDMGRPIEFPGVGKSLKTLPELCRFSLSWALFSGPCTPVRRPSTEAGALGAFIVLCVAVFHSMKWENLEDALLETAKLTVMIFALIWGVLIFVRVLGYSGLPAEFAEWIISLREERGFPPVVIMILILCGYAILGMFMDAIGMLLTLPVVCRR